MIDIDFTKNIKNNNNNIILVIFHIDLKAIFFGYCCISGYGNYTQ